MSRSPEAPGAESETGRIEIDRRRCEGHGVCAATAPELIRIDDQGETIVEAAEVRGAALARARAAVRACPIAALRLV